MNNPAMQHTPPLAPALTGASLTVAVEGGLCNRMRAALSAAGVAAASGCPVRVSWSSGSECGCRFDDVFAYPFEGRAGIPGSLSVHPPRLYDIPSSRRNLWLPSLLRRFAYRACRSNYQGGEGDDVLSLLARYGKVYISTCYEFFESAVEMKDLFRPSPHVLETVRQLSAGFNENTLGIHIRTGDNVMSRLHSPARLFIERAHAEVSRNPQACFFLATDSAEVKSAFASEFPGRVITADAQLSRSTYGGMVAAAVDLFALARTTRILGSYYSSFSGTAAELGGIPLETLKIR